MLLQRAFGTLCDLILSYSDRCTILASNSRHHVAPGQTRLAWAWMLVPAIVTHGTYDSILFFILTFGVADNDSRDPVPEFDDSAPQQTTAFDWSVVAMIAGGWIYLLLPVFWVKHKLINQGMGHLWAMATTKSGGGNWGGTASSNTFPMRGAAEDDGEQGNELPAAAVEMQPLAAGLGTVSDGQS